MTSTRFRYHVDEDRVSPSALSSSRPIPNVLTPSPPYPYPSTQLYRKRQRQFSGSSYHHNTPPPPYAHLSPPSSSRLLPLPPTDDAYRLEYAQELSPLTTPEKRLPMSALKRKVVVMGSPSVGKTSLTNQYITPPNYNDSYYPTIETTMNKTVTFQGNEYECEIIDSAGQDEYTLFPAKYAVGVHGYVLVYSITSRQSFQMIQTVHDKILDFAGQTSVPCVIVGQKCDLGEARQVKADEGEALAKKLGAVFLETSAKDNKNVGKVFDLLLGEMQKTYNPAPEKKKSGWFSWGK